MNNGRTITKVMAEAGIASRRKSEVLITSGHVKVNGKTVTTLGVKVEPSDHVEVDGVPLNAEKLVYYLFYKPRGSLQLFMMRRAVKRY